MPKCVKCDKYFHPDYCVVVNEEDKACKCVFCYTEKKTVTVEDKETGQTDKVLTKTEAEDAYKRYIQDLRYDEKILEVLAGRGTARPKPRN